MNTPRRNFIVSSAAALGSLSLFPLLTHAKSSETEAPADNPKRPRQPLSLVREFVQAAHFDLPKVKAMLTDNPALIYASWDWGNGDWETALEGASHMARSDTVTYLLEKGARANPFSLAMLGKAGAVEAILNAEPTLAYARGPHFLTLLFHAALSSNLAPAVIVAGYLETDSARHFNQALRGAAEFGTKEMAAWLIANGVTDVNPKNFFGKTPLDLAEKRNAASIVTLLKENGGINGSP